MTLQVAGEPPRASLPRPAPAGDAATVTVAPALAVCVVIPAFNEARSVAEVVAAARLVPAVTHVVVVDDASEDDTGARASAAGAAVVRLPVNLGIGGAVQAGYRYALRHGFDVAIQIDGDGQHYPSELGRLLEPILAGRADMVVGSRWLGRGDYVAAHTRRFGMRVLARIVRWRTGRTLTDTTSGFRAIGRRGVELFARSYPRDFPEVESLVHAVQHGLRVEEVGVRMSDRAHGKSSIAGFKSAYYMARVVVALLVDTLNRKERP